MVWQCIYVSDAYQAHQKLPLVSSLRMPQRMSHEVDDVGLSPDDVVIKNMSGADMLGTGLKNEVGEYNCFLNVIIQVTVIPLVKLFRFSYLSYWCTSFFNICSGLCSSCENSVFVAFKTISKWVLGEINIRACSRRRSLRCVCIIWNFHCPERSIYRYTTRSSCPFCSEDCSKQSISR